MSWPTSGQVWLRPLQPSSSAPEHPGSFSIVLICLGGSCLSVACSSYYIQAGSPTCKPRLDGEMGSIYLIWKSLWFCGSLKNKTNKYCRQAGWNLITLNSSYIFRKIIYVGGSIQKRNQKHSSLGNYLLFICFESVSSDSENFPVTRSTQSCVATEQRRLAACLGESSLSCSVLAQTRINKGPRCPLHHQHVTLGAYEKILVSFTAHRDTHSPSFLLQGRDAATVAPLPHSVSRHATQMNVHAHALTPWPLSIFYSVIILQWMVTQIYAAAMGVDMYSVLRLSQSALVCVLPFFSRCVVNCKVWMSRTSAVLCGGVTLPLMRQRCSAMSFTICQSVMMTQLYFSYTLHKCFFPL